MNGPNLLDLSFHHLNGFVKRDISPTVVGGHEILPSGGHEPARWWPTRLPGGGQLNCPR
jgi:hypothetical protein